jgi:hypothetical protein
LIASPKRATTSGCADSAVRRLIVASGVTVAGGASPRIEWP